MATDQGIPMIPRFESVSRYDGYNWKPRPESLRLLLDAKALLDDSPRPMTVRQLYYRLVAALTIPNNIRSYQNLVGLLTRARKVDILPLDKFVDRARAKVDPRGYESLEDYLRIVENAYQRKASDQQPDYIEVWTEKDALSAVIGDVLRPYGPVLVVSKGYTSYTVLVEAANRFREQVAERGVEHCHLLYFGDWDPSGEDIFRVICRELAALTGECVSVDDEDSGLHIEKVALTRDLVDAHNLPPMPTKASDSRSTRFVAAHGDEAVELDALPPEVLEDVVGDAVRLYFDEEIREDSLETEGAENDEIKRAVRQIRDARKEGNR